MSKLFEETNWDQNSLKSKIPAKTKQNYKLKVWKMVERDVYNYNKYLLTYKK